MLAAVFGYARTRGSLPVDAHCAQRFDQQHVGTACGLYTHQTDGPSREIDVISKVVPHSGGESEGDLWLRLDAPLKLNLIGTNTDLKHPNRSEFIFAVDLRAILP